MAGKRQHYITAHLLTGFADVPSRDAGKAYLYRGGKVVRPSVNNIACESYFYSKEFPGSLDEKVTSYEDNLAATIDSYRDCEPWDELPPEEIAEVVTHFVIRGTFLRQHFTESLCGLLHGIKTNPKLILGSLPHWMTVLMETDQGRAAVQNLFDEMMNELALADFGQIAKDAQTDVLDDILSKPCPKHELAIRDALSKLHWRVLPYENAILPDCVSICLKGNHLWRQTSIWRNGGMEGDETEVVFFPIAATKVCVGTKTKETAMIQPSWMADYNDHAARLSRTYFVAKAPVEKRLHSLIGSDADELVQDLVNGYFSRQPPRQ